MKPRNLERQISTCEMLLAKNERICLHPIVTGGSAVQTQRRGNNGDHVPMFQHREAIRIFMETTLGVFLVG